MRFRTEVEIPQSIEKIEIEDRIFSIGSCFSSEISTILKKGQLQTFENPYGTIFNPYSISHAIERIHEANFYSEQDLVLYKDDVISLDHHSSFNSRYVHQTLDQINHQIQFSNEFLQQTNWVIITYGTSFVYEFLPKNKLVANCHKIPGKFFEKKLLSHQQITDSIEKTILNLKDISKEGVQILFTVSPVRHTKEGMVENNWSKSKLISAIHEVVPKHENCHYLPVYEIMMDDLRDYRFYKKDMIHPNEQAIEYIFEKFGNAYFSEQTKDFVSENFKINQALHHKTQDVQNPKHQEFLAQIKERMAYQQSKVKHQLWQQ